MSRKPLKPCNKVGCPNLTKGKYCDVHKPVDQQDVSERNKYYDMYVRDQKSKAFYNSKEWIVVREVRKRLDNNLCRMCLDENRLVAADVCDHIIPIKVDWSKRLDLNNTQMLCHGHHNQKTLEDKKKYGI